jgi:hypothetical protein
MEELGKGRKNKQYISRMSSEKIKKEEETSRMYNIILGK